MTEQRTIEGYTITRPEIAHGGSGLVHEALAPDGKTKVAIKVLDREIIEQKVLRSLKSSRDGAARNTEFTEKTRRAYELNVERFKIEYQTILQLTHPNIAKVHKIGFHDGHFYMVSEFVEGKPIAEYVRGWKPIDMIPIFVQFLEGLDYIHRHGLIHLDIKSENILVQEVGGKPQVKIIDFGLAMTPKEYRGSFLGSAGTMAPEVALGLKDKVDARSDLYSAGRVLYYCITWGFYPISRPAHSRREVIQNMIKREATLSLDPPSFAHNERNFVPEHLDKIVMHLIAYEPENRYYGNARAIINALITKMPEAFAETSDTRAAYLRPKGGRHIGRDEEQKNLTAAIDALAGGEDASAIFVIRGESGLGKTHLMQKIREFAQRHVEKLSILEIDFPASEARFELWNRELMRNFDDNARPVVVFADDAHLAQSAAAEAIRGIAQRITDRKENPALYCETQPIMLCLAIQNSNSYFPFPDPCSLKVIDLGPFTEALVRSYLESTPALAGKEISQEWASALLARTDGIPRDLVDHLTTRDSEGVLFTPDGEIVVAGYEMRHERPPESTRERLLNVYHALPATERSILNFLSVWNSEGVTRPASRDDLANFFYGHSVIQAANDLISRGILKKIDACLGFSNEYFLKLVYESVSEEEREAMHDSIADYLKTDKDATAFHRAFGRDKRAAINNCIKMGRKQMEQHGRINTALALFDRAGIIAPPNLYFLQVYLLCLKVDCHCLSGKYDEAERTHLLCKTLLAEAPRNSKMWNTVVLLRYVNLLIRQKKHTEAREEIEGGITAWEKRPVTFLLITLLNYKARDLYEKYFESNSEGEEPLLQAVEIYKRSHAMVLKLPAGNIDRETNNHLGFVLRLLGKYEEAVKWLEEKLNAGTSNIFSLMMMFILLAETYRRMCKYDDASCIAKQAFVLAKEVAEGKWLVSVHEILANTFHDTDRFDDAIAEVNRAISVGAYLKHDAEYSAATVRLMILAGHCYKELKKFNRAEVLFEAAIGAHASGFHLASAYVGLAEICLHREARSDASEYLAKVEGLLAELPEQAVMPYHFRVTRLKIDIMCKGGEFEEASSLLRRLYLASGSNKKLLAEYGDVERKIKEKR